jgi:hypothetical protein
MLLLLHRLCKEYGSPPSVIMQEDAGLLMQLMEVGGIVADAEIVWAGRARADVTEQAAGQPAGGGWPDGRW